MTKRRRRVAVATVLLALALPAGAASADPGGGNGQTTPPGQAKKAEAAQGQGQGNGHGRGDGQGNRPAVPPGLAKQGESEAGPRSVPPGWARAAERAANRPATLTGTVASVGDGSVTVTVKGGHPLFRLWAAMNGTADAPAAVTVTLADGAVVRRDGVQVALSELVVGDHVSIRGTFADGTVTAGRVNAAAPDPSDEATPESD